ncbi:alpha/beta hydrolase [Mesorhizobium sp. BR1-1-16]|uniref:alpha/beta hydrolase family protein n=1 Tax=Mesorhizobium sp. BR1-1-16 TaxID=2876653 RepID=UPI001CCF6B28|nr:alpha/beta hydrolase [Mesorhizobium sp. BR1-1-16]MBZ9934776.1 alpha/beta hydrolase [Mesorhizobium sp. BR1-1-16]
MFRPSRRVAVLAALVALFAAPSIKAHAEDAVPVSAGVTYEPIGHWDAAKLNEILTIDAPKVFGVSVTYTPAVNGVLLYRVTYHSVVPERGNKPIVATGLLAIPDTETKSVPLVSYQHGTVYGKEDVPSYPDNSSETQLMLAQFAGQGYALIGADYFGMGASKEPEGYGVKGSHQQATFDMLMASRAVLGSMGISTSKLFLGGWSQGGYVTMAFLEKLEKSGVEVTAASTASGPADLYSFLSGFLDFPRENDASWISILYVLSSFSFEHYYGMPGLARSFISEDYYEAARKIYERESSDISALPTDLKKLIRPEYFNPSFFAESAYGRIAAASDAFRWIIKTPVRSYYGESDEVVSVGLAKLAMNYQQGIGGGNIAVEAISTGKTDHRGTFATAVAQWKIWFDSLK